MCLSIVLNVSGLPAFLYAETPTSSGVVLSFRSPTAQRWAVRGRMGLSLYHCILSHVHHRIAGSGALADPDPHGCFCCTQEAEGCYGRQPWRDALGDQHHSATRAMSPCHDPPFSHVPIPSHPIRPSYIRPSSIPTSQSDLASTPAASRDAGCHRAAAVAGASCG